MAKWVIGSEQNTHLISPKILDQVPWSLQGKIQNKNSLYKNIETLSKRLKAEAVGNPHVHVICIFEPAWQKHLVDLLLSLKLQVWPNLSITIITYNKSQKKIVDRASQDCAFEGEVRCFTGSRDNIISDLIQIHKHTSSNDGDFFALVNMSDLVHPLAFYNLIEASRLDKTLNFFYPNVAKVSSRGNLLKSFCHKPDFDVSTLIRRNFLGTFCLIKASLIGELARSSLPSYPDRLAPFGWHPLFLALSQLNEFNAKHTHQFLYLERLVPWPIKFKELSKKTYANFFSFIALAVSAQKPNLSLAFKLKFSRKKPYFEVACAGGGKKKVLIVVYRQNSKRDDNAPLRRVIKNIERQDRENIKVEILNLGSKPEGWERSQKKYSSALKVFFFSEFMGLDLSPHYINEGINKLGLHFDYLMLWRQDLVYKKSAVLKTLCGELSFNSQIAAACTRLAYKKDLGFSGLLLKARKLNEELVFKTREMSSDEYGKQERTSCFVNYSGVMLNKTFWDSIKKEKISILSVNDQVELTLRAIRKGFKFFYFGSLVGRLGFLELFHGLHDQPLPNYLNHTYKKEIRHFFEAQYYVEKNTNTSE